MMEWLETDDNLLVLLPDKHPKKTVKLETVLAIVRKCADGWEYEITATKEKGTRNSRMGALNLVNSKLFTF